MMNNLGTYGFWGMGWLFMIVFWILVIAGIVALVKALSNTGQSGNTERKPLTILEERYARGEIDKKEFEEKKKDLLR